MNYFVNILVLVACAITLGPQPVNSLFEDQVGKFDWYVSLFYFHISENSAEKERQVKYDQKVITSQKSFLRRVLDRNRSMENSFSDAVDIRW